MSTHMCLDCDSPGDGNCPACHGMGKVLGENSPATFGGLGDEVSCASCTGSGECQKCDGSGLIEVGGEG
jgi:DnaJ-class molecular chaperone